MSDHERRSGGHGAGGGERSEPEPAPCPPRRRRTAPPGEGKPKSVRVYTPEERRAAIEAQAKSNLSIDAFAKTFGVSPVTFQAWLRAYREHGPKGLEHPFGKKKRGRKPLPQPLREEIVSVKRRFPDFGLRKIRDFLSRFRGLKVSPGGVRSTLAAEGIPPAKKPKRRGRGKPAVRRFERSRPRELWQSDITSFVLARESRRVYLTVFLDDYSRYVVSFGLELHQRQELVTEALLDGIQRFGKPNEILTDQGRQYFAWRGKSDFQKLLVKEGIAHVVSRAHHPETLGKCERLWETIGQEFWDRAHPEDLAEARERLTHYVAHYNHFRPHQGIDGLVPADRFFDAETTVRKTIEQAMAENELRLALGERPRKPVFLFGQIGDRQVSLSGERGRLVVHTPDGAVETIQLDELGTRGAMSHEERRGQDEHGPDHDERGDVGREHGAGGLVGDEAAGPGSPGTGRDSGGAGSGGEPDAGGGPRGTTVAGAREAEEALREAPHAHVPSRLPDPSALAPGERGGEAAGARALHSDTGILGRDREQERERGKTQRPADPALADEPAGGVGDGVRAPQTAENPSAEGAILAPYPGGECDRGGVEPSRAAQGDRAAEEGSRAARQPDRGPEVAPQQPDSRALAESAGGADAVDVVVGEGGACGGGKERAPERAEEEADALPSSSSSGPEWRRASGEVPRGGVSDGRSRSDSA